MLVRSDTRSSQFFIDSTPKSQNAEGSNPRQGLKLVPQTNAHCSGLLEFNRQSECVRGEPAEEGICPLVDLCLGVQVQGIENVKSNGQCTLDKRIGLVF